MSSADALRSIRHGLLGGPSELVGVKKIHNIAGRGCDGAAAGEVFVLLPRVVITGVGLERADYRQ